MAYPALVTPIDAFTTTYHTAAIAGNTEVNQVIPLGPTIGWFEVDATGAPTQIPLGQSGPFLISIHNEDILCNSLENGVATVYEDATLNGRGYNGTTIVAHSTPGSGNLDVTLLSTSVQSTFASTTGVQTLTNKRITRRTLGITANTATPAIDTDLYDFVDITGQTTIITSMTTNLTGTPQNGDLLQIAITGSATAITWGSGFESSTVTLPAITVTTARLDNFFAWNPVTSKWRIYMSA
jgi:hypothetical protein